MVTNYLHSTLINFWISFQSCSSATKEIATPPFPARPVLLFDERMFHIGKIKVDNKAIDQYQFHVPNISSYENANFFILKASALSISEICHHVASAAIPFCVVTPHYLRHASFLRILKHQGLDS
jgi:hypothetical protein